MCRRGETLHTQAILIAYRADIVFSCDRGGVAVVTPRTRVNISPESRLLQMIRHDHFECPKVSPTHGTLDLASLGQLVVRPHFHAFAVDGMPAAVSAVRQLLS